MILILIFFFIKQSNILSHDCFKIHAKQQQQQQQQQQQNNNNTKYKVNNLDRKK